MKIDMDAACAQRIIILLFIISAGTTLMTGCNREPGNPEIYLKYCAACHGPEGEGLRSLYPPLQGSAYLGKHIDRLPCLIANGVKGTPTTTNKPPKMRMPSFNHLDIGGMSDLIIYLHTNWGAGGTTPSKQDVETWLRDCR